MTYQLLGLALFFIGCSHLINRVVPIETRIVQYLQTKFRNRPWLSFFQELWLFGRTSFALISLTLLTTLKWKLGITATLGFLVIVGIEQIIKTRINRPRPFTVNQDIQMLQLTRPQDSSFPSGDALRIWYLVLIIPSAAGGYGFFLAASVLLAILVTLGRSIMGVHYPTDTIAGAGLGLLAAGTILSLWQYLSLL